MKFSEDNTTDPITVVGLMSGTSMDGTDLCACQFSEANGQWSYQILATETISYSENRLESLRQFPLLNGEELIRTHAELGKYYGLLIKDFIKKHDLNPDLIEYK